MTDPAELAQFHGVAREQDFRAVFDREVGYVWNVMRRLGVAEAERNDLTQEVFLTVYTLFDDYDRSRPIKPWLFGIAYRTALRHFKLARNARELPIEHDEPVDETSSAETQLEGKDQQDRVVAVLDRMDFARRAVLVMKEVEGYSVPEIARALGIPLNTAYSRLRLARADFEAGWVRENKRRSLG